MTSGALLASAFAMGLTGSAHCAMMCGPISSVLCGPRPARASASRGLVAVGYNAGRIASYGAIGLFVGWVGGAAAAGSLDAVRFGFRALAAVCLLTVGLHLAGLPSFARALEAAGAPLWRRVAPVARRLLPLRSPWHALAAGGLWALMPCGLLYGAIALAASAGSAQGGAAAMAAFGAGTLPIMLGTGALAMRAGRALARGWVRRTAGLLMLAFGLWSSVGLASQIGLGRHGAHACCPRR